MAERKDRQGTGKQPHKSAEEPYPQQQAPPREQHQASSLEHQAPAREHKEPPRPAEKARTAHAGTGHNTTEKKGSEPESTDDLKEREYRDEQGNIRHHTRPYMEEHGKK